MDPDPPMCPLGALGLGPIEWLGDLGLDVIGSEMNPVVVYMFLHASNWVLYRFIFLNLNGVSFKFSVCYLNVFYTRESESYVLYSFQHMLFILGDTFSIYQLRILRVSRQWGVTHGHASSSASSEVIALHKPADQAFEPFAGSALQQSCGT